MTAEGRVKESVCQWLALQRGVEFWVTSSVGIYDAARGVYRKAKWARPGQADVWGFLSDNRPFWLELKSDKGRLSDPQVAFRTIIESRGHLYALVRSTRDAEDAFKRWNPAVPN